VSCFKSTIEMRAWNCFYSREPQRLAKEQNISRMEDIQNPYAFV
jgi:hypothetical protein